MNSNNLEPQKSYSTGLKKWILIFGIILGTIIIGLFAYFFIYKNSTNNSQTKVSNTEKSQYFDQLKDLLLNEISSKDEISLVILDINFLKKNNHQLLFVKNGLKLYDVENRKEEIILDKLEDPQLSQDRKYLSFYEGDISVLSSFNKIVRINFADGKLSKNESKENGSFPIISGDYLAFASGKLESQAKNLSIGKETFGVDETELWTSNLQNFQPKKIGNFEDFGFALNRSDVSWSQSKIYFKNQNDKYSAFSLADNSVKELDLGSDKILDQYPLSGDSFALSLETPAVFSPDKNQLAYLYSNDDKITIKDLSSGQENNYLYNMDGQNREFLSPFRLEWLDKDNLFVFLMGYGGMDTGKGISLQRINFNEGKTLIIKEDENSLPEDFIGNKPISKDSQFLAWMGRKIQQCSNNNCDEGPTRHDAKMTIFDIQSKKEIALLFDEKALDSVFEGQILGWL